MTMEHFISLAVYGIILLFVIIQWFLSLRPFFLWGLLMPLLFAGLWYVAVMRPENALLALLPFTDSTYTLYAEIGRLGVLFSLAIYALSRAAMLLKKSMRKRARQRRLEEKRQRQLREAAAMAASEPENMRG